MFARVYRLEISVGLATLSVLAAFLWISKWERKKVKRALQEINYEMVRPKSSFLSEFDLAQRQIERNYHNPFARGGSQATATGPGVRSKLRSKKLVPTPVSKPGAKNPTAKKKPTLQTRVVERSPRPQLTASWAETSDHVEPMANYEDIRKRAKAADSKASSDGPRDSTDVEEVKDWKKIFATAPTAAHMLEMNKEYTAGKVPAELYFEIVNDLMVSQNPADQKVGLIGLTGSPNHRGFVESVHLMSQPEVQKTPGLPQAIESFQTSFSQKTRLGIMSQALQTPEPEVMIRAMFVIQYGLGKLSAANNFGPTRASDNAELSADAKSYERFIVPLKALEKSPEPELAQPAAQTLGLILKVVPQTE